MWGIRVATRASVAREGEHADDANIWVRVNGWLTFPEEHLAWEACDDLDKDEDGMLVHRPVELNNTITIPANTLVAGETYKL